MSKDCRNIYRISRELAGMTQERVAPFLGCAVRTLSDYENGTHPPDDIVRQMVKVYRIPALAYWHFKANEHLGEYLPDVYEPQTCGDMGFLVVLSSDDLEEALMIVKEVLADGRIDPSEHGNMRRCASLLRAVAGRLISAALYVETEIAQNDDLPDAS
ncbi:helix-turn-helix transcriptional regulator [Eubacteriales bacterium OttesenSCG-928-N13]|nr:helix-turn-helix transcriptional regulator [Eubacteriales bacterium OttesenSCG-928-N13]